MIRFALTIVCSLLVGTSCTYRAMQYPAPAFGGAIGFRDLDRKDYRFTGDVSGESCGTLVLGAIPIGYENKAVSLSGPGLLGGRHSQGGSASWIGPLIAGMAAGAAGGTLAAILANDADYTMSIGAGAGAGLGVGLIAGGITMSAGGVRLSRLEQAAMYNAISGQAGMHGITAVSTRSQTNNYLVYRRECVKVQGVGIQLKSD